MEPRLNAPPALNIEALARLGELLKQTPKAKGTRSQLRARGVIGGSTPHPPIKTLADRQIITTVDGRIITTVDGRQFG